MPVAPGECVEAKGPLWTGPCRPPAGSSSLHPSRDVATDTCAPRGLTGGMRNVSLALHVAPASNKTNSVGSCGSQHPPHACHTVLMTENGSATILIKGNMKRRKAGTTD